MRRSSRSPQPQNPSYSPEKKRHANAKVNSVVARFSSCSFDKTLRGPINAVGQSCSSRRLKVTWLPPSTSYSARLQDVAKEQKKTQEWQMVAKKVARSQHDECVPSLSPLTTTRALLHQQLPAPLDLDYIPIRPRNFLSDEAVYHYFSVLSCRGDAKCMFTVQTTQRVSNLIE
jgi:hypothetical protein